MNKKYKFIGFDRLSENGKPLWYQPMLESSLFLSLRKQLRTVNDEYEFTHTWDSHSYIINKYFGEIREAYDHIFDNAGVLCLTENFSPEMWLRYCPKGGVVYEFDFDPAIAISNKVSSGPIIYADKKNINVPSYLMQKTQHREIKRILYNGLEPSLSDRDIFKKWYKSGEPTLLSLQHLKDELTFKKLDNYAIEHEYRFVHPLEAALGGPKLKVKIQNSKMTFGNLGLSLSRIFTDDVARVKDRGLKHHKFISSLPWSS